MPGDADQPGREQSSLPVEAFATLPGLDEHLLCHVLGVGELTRRP
jgi:hypothetical protein